MPDYRSPGYMALADLFKQAVKEGGDAYENAQDRNLKMRMPDIEEANREKFSTFQSDQKENLLQKHFNQLRDFVEEQAKAGRKLNVKMDGLDVSQADESPYKYLFQAPKAGNTAASKAYDMYSKGLDGLTKSVSAAQEGLDAIHDPKQIGSMGIARSTMLRSMGMNRYNGDEAFATLPPALRQQAKQLFLNVSKGWDGESVKADDDNNPMTEPQKAAVESFFRGVLQNSKTLNETYKNKARGYLRSSGYYNPSTSQMLEDGFNSAGYNDYVDKILAPKQGTPPSNYQSPPPQSSTPAQQQGGGFLGGLKKMFGMGQSTSNPTPQADDPQMQRYLELKQKYGK